jgi:hypothetical protein
MTSQLIVATTHSLLVYSLPLDPSSPTNEKGKNKEQVLSLAKTVDVPTATIGEGSTFRQIKCV